MERTTSGWCCDIHTNSAWPLCAFELGTLGLRSTVESQENVAERAKALIEADIRLRHARDADRPDRLVFAGDALALRPRRRAHSPGT